MSGFPTACCCRAFFFAWAPGHADLADEFRRSFRTALLAPESCDGLFSRGNLHLFSMLDPLPADPKDWPADSRDAIDSGTLARLAPRFRFYRCRALGPDGLCSIHPRRPYVCRSFQPNAADCASRPCGWWCSASGSCRPRPASGDGTSPG